MNPMKASVARKPFQTFLPRSQRVELRNVGARTVAATKVDATLLTNQPFSKNTESDHFNLKRIGFSVVQRCLSCIYTKAWSTISQSILV